MLSLIFAILSSAWLSRAARRRGINPIRVGFIGFLLFYAIYVNADWSMRPFFQTSNANFDRTTDVLVDGCALGLATTLMMAGGTIYLRAASKTAG